MREPGAAECYGSDYRAQKGGLGERKLPGLGFGYWGALWGWAMYLEQGSVALLSPSASPAPCSPSPSWYPSAPPCSMATTWLW